MNYLIAFLLVVVLLGNWFLTLFGMPGNWLMVVATAAYVYFVPGDSPAAIGWQVVVILVVFAALGELIEFLAGAVGTAKAGGSKRGVALALVGSIAGGIFGLFVGLPIPLIGSLVAALLFAGAGALGGAMLGEVWAGKDVPASWKVGKAAFRGRLIGTLGKLVVGAFMVGIAVVALVL